MKKDLSTITDAEWYGLKKRASKHFVTNIPSPHEQARIQKHNVDMKKKYRHN